ncbi:MAG: TetR/AcrR family transcriptional regulator [Pseudomonadales bacterium]|nr:TetR/AcrR family transcriptional regulator [Pseudomonadales bacterium]
MAKHEPRDVRRAQILDAALSCFGKSGFERTTMADIVTASGLSKGSLYWHFENKEAILIALFDQYNDELEESWALMDAMPPADYVKTQGAMIFSALLDDRRMVEAWMDFISHPAGRQRMSDLYTRYRARLAETLAGISAQPEALAASVVAVIEGLLLQAIVNPSFDPVPAWDVAAESLLH